MVRSFQPVGMFPEGFSKRAWPVVFVDDEDCACLTEALSYPHYTLHETGDSSVVMPVAIYSIFSAYHCFSFPSLPYLRHFGKFFVRVQVVL